MENIKHYIDLVTLLMSCKKVLYLKWSVVTLIVTVTHHDTQNCRENLFLNGQAAKYFFNVLKRSNPNSVSHESKLHINQ